MYFGLRPCIRNKHYIAYQFIHSFIRTFSHSIARSVIHSIKHSFILSSIHSFIYSFIHTFIQTFIRSPDFYLQWILHEHIVVYLTEMFISIYTFIVSKVSIFNPLTVSYCFLALHVLPSRWHHFGHLPLPTRSLPSGVQFQPPSVSY